MNERQFEAFQEWQRRFDRPYLWMLAAVIILPIIGLLFARG
jgi:hypothetical protein